MAVAEMHVGSAERHKALRSGDGKRTYFSSGPNKGRPNAYRYAERCLFDFPDNKARLQSLQEMLEILEKGASVKAQNYDAFLSGGGPSNPVAARVEHIEQLRDEVKRLEQKVNPIQRFVNDLKAHYVLNDSPKTDMLKIMQLYYFGRNALETVANELDLAMRTFYRKRQEIVKRAIYYMGL